MLDEEKFFHSELFEINFLIKYLIRLGEALQAGGSVLAMLWQVRVTFLPDFSRLHFPDLAVQEFDKPTISWLFQEFRFFSFE